MKTIILLTLLITASGAALQAQQTELVMSDKTGWHKIGMTTVDYSMESDVIEVIGADRFTAIIIKVNEAPINLISFDIYFESGDRQNVIIRKIIQNPGETGIVKLAGGERSIKKIVFVYKTVPNTLDKKAQLELWGLKTNPDKKSK